MKPELVLKGQAEFEQIHKNCRAKGAHQRHTFVTELPISPLSTVLKISGRRARGAGVGIE